MLKCKIRAILPRVHILSITAIIRVNNNYCMHFYEQNNVIHVVRSILEVMVLSICISTAQLLC